jgi:signal transduction histidine kinase
VPKLTVVQGADAGKEFVLAGTTVAVGRHSGNAVALRDDQVSRKHLELRLMPGGGYHLFDLRSGNGTTVNGRVVQAVELRDGDRIGVGGTVLRYAADEPRPVPARVVLRPTGEYPSAILWTVAADAGSQILTRPDRANDWLRTRLASLTVLYEATTAVSHILDVDELLDRILGLVLRAADADHGCFLLTDPESGEPMPRAVRTRDTLAAPAEVAVSRTVVDHVLRERQGVLVADAGADERFRDGESIARHQLREVICVPMKGRHETVGVLFLDTRSPAGPPTPQPGQAAAVKFTEDHLTLAVAVAHQAALAVEETRYYQALLQAERLAAVGQTITALSHHIKNIMQGVRFGSDMVRMGLDGEDRELLQKGWRLVEKNQAKIDHLILDMLSYSKDREPAVEPTDLAALADDVLDVVRGRAADAGVELVFSPADLGPVSCDPEGIHRALLNVVGNAVDAVEGRPDPRVTVTVSRSDDGAFAEVAVADTGPGIPAEGLADVFRPFVSTKGAKGTGLGLPVSRKILREHGGDVTVESAPGTGCRFVLRIPIGSS